MTSTALSSPRQARAGGRTRGGIIGGRPGYWLLRRLGAKAATTSGDATAYAHRSKLEVLLGKDVWETVASKVVIDFGCGNGDEALEIARRGAARVIGVDIREAVLADARRRASAEGLTNCVFDTATDEHADVILSLDAFEHFDDPAGVLRAMRDLLKPDGFVLAAFGPTWLHPLGGHLFSVFPWAHLIFTEQALLRWRSDFKTDARAGSERSRAG